MISRAGELVAGMVLFLCCFILIGCAGVTGTSTSRLPATFSISGNIGPGSSGSGATVILSGATGATTTADSSGNYTLSGLSSGSYALTPSKTGLSFSPPSQGVTVSGASVSEVNFNTGQPALTISGSISPASLGSGATIALGGTASAITTVDSSGNYSFSDLSNGSYTLTPSKTGFTFSLSSQTVTANGSNIPGVNFTASAAATPSGPIVINRQNGTVIEGLKITSTSGDCVTITNSTNITIQNSEIGPCAGNGIKISGGNGIDILDNYIHPETLAAGCCDSNDGVFSTGGTQNLLIQGNVIAYGESNIEVQGGKTVTVTGNFLLNPRDEQGGIGPRGNNFQCWNNCSYVTVQNNYALSSLDTTEYLYPEATADSISFGDTTGFVIQSNFNTGGHSQAGCGIMADTFSNRGQILNNSLLNTGQCGIGITDGSHIANGNKVYNTNPVTGSGNTAMYAAHFGQSSTCGPLTIIDNIADELKPDGTHSGWWDGGNCGPINIDTDIFGASADTLLTPTSTIFAPPLIPPEPRNCVVTSPYSTQTSLPPCVP
jgi:hypothetical protein